MRSIRTLQLSFNKKLFLEIAVTKIEMRMPASRVLPRVKNNELEIKKHFLIAAIERKP